MEIKRLIPVFLLVVLCASMTTAAGAIDITPIKNLTSIDIVKNVERVSVVDRIGATPRLSIGGTDYNIGEPARVFVTVSESGAEGMMVDDASCVLKVFYPNNTVFIPYTSMTFLSDGIYYHDFVVPNTTGVYVLDVLCTYHAVTTRYNLTSIIVNSGVNAGTIANTYAIDGTYYRQTETGGTGRTISTDYNFSVSGLNQTATPIYSISSFLNSLRQDNGDANNDMINIYIYDYNSSSWLLISSPFNYTQNYANYTFVVSPLLNMSNFVSPQNTITWRINDTIIAPTDIKDNDLYIDAFNLILVTRIANQSIENIAGGGELNVKNYIEQIRAMLNNITNTSFYVTDLNNTLNSIMAALSGNFTLIQARFNSIDAQLSTINGSSVNLTCGNFTELSENLTQVIIEESNNPPLLDLETVILGILLLMLVALIFVNNTVYFVILGITYISSGVFLAVISSPFIGVTVVVTGLMFFVMAWWRR